MKLKYFALFKNINKNKHILPYDQLSLELMIILQFSLYCLNVFVQFYTEQLLKAIWKLHVLEWINWQQLNELNWLCLFLVHLSLFEFCIYAQCTHWSCFQSICSNQLTQSFFFSYKIFSFFRVCFQSINCFFFHQ